MGLTRKLMSVGTMGAVDFRSDKERTAAYTKAAKKEARKQTEIMRQQAREQARSAQAAAQRAAQTAMPVVATPAQAAPTPKGPQLPPAGWYPDMQDASVVRWFDGTQWTDFTQPKQA